MALILPALLWKSEQSEKESKGFAELPGLAVAERRQPLGAECARAVAEYLPG